MDQPDVLYRYSYIKQDDKAVLVLETYKILKVTPRGYWIERFPNGYRFGKNPHLSSVNHIEPVEKRWVSNDGASRFARQTEELALESLRRRGIKHLAILEYQKNILLSALNQVEQIQTPDQKPRHFPQMFVHNPFRVVEDDHYY